MVRYGEQSNDGRWDIIFLRARGLFTPRALDAVSANQWRD